MIRCGAEYGVLSHSTKIITLQDISKLRADEKERALLLERMSESNRLEALGTLAGGVAHEINTPTQYIGDNLSFIKEWLPHLLDIIKSGKEASKTNRWDSIKELVDNFKYDVIAPELTQATEQSLGGVARIAVIVEAIKDFSFPSGKNQNYFNLNKVIETAVTVTTSQWKHVATTRLNLDPDLPPLYAVEGEVNQILVNLITNAAYAIGQIDRQELGVIEIKSNVREGFIEFSVADNGPGFTEENSSQIFQLFFTTKPPGEGTGQGLAICQAIVTRHGGNIKAESELGSGAKFIVQFPQTY